MPKALAKVARIMKIVLINLLILVLLLEIASVIAYRIGTGAFFYGRSPRQLIKVQKPVAGPANPNGPLRAVQQLQPYFGFIGKSGVVYQFPFSSVRHIGNNFGFAGDQSYPFKKQPNQFVVGVFGGSVAANYAMFEMERNVLAAELKKIPALANKEIVVLSFAAGAFKQPQQLIILNYFLSLGQDLDLVVNIDGFNDVAISYLNVKDGLDTSMPGGFVFLPLVKTAAGGLSEDELRFTLDLVEARKQLEKAVAGMESARTATGYFFSWAQARLAQRRSNRAVVALDHSRGMVQEQSFMQIVPPRTADDNEVFKQIIGEWSRSSLMMKAMLDQRNIPYFEFIQPNQYANSNHVFGTAERAIAINEASPFQPGATRGYPLLVTEMEHLKSLGVNIQSAISIFDQTTEAVYVDNCCHFNERGSQIFSQFVASRIANDLASEIKQPAGLQRK